MRKKRKVRRKRRLTKLDEFKKVCKKYLIIENDEYIDIQFGAFFANKYLDSKPVWIHIVGPPGSGKTEILQAFDGHPDIYSLSNLTANSLISGMVVASSEKDPSLLPKLDNKIVTIKDFTVILKERHDTVTAIFGQLRDAYDGTGKKVYGTGKDITYKSKFGLITAVTGEIDKHLGKLSTLGARFLVYRMPQISDTEKVERAGMVLMQGASSLKEKKIKKYAHYVLNLKPPIPTISDEHKCSIVQVAMFVAIARTHVDRDYRRQSLGKPEPEIPTRLTKQLTDLALGIAMV